MFLEHSFTKHKNVVYRTHSNLPFKNNMQIKTVKCLVWQKHTYIHNKIECTETVNQSEKFHSYKGEKSVNNLKEQQSIYYIKYEKVKTNSHNA